jgi:hypothetical protein
MPLYIMSRMYCIPYTQCHACIVFRVRNVTHVLFSVYAMSLMYFFPCTQCHSCIIFRVRNVTHVLFSVYAMSLMYFFPCMQCHVREQANFQRWNDALQTKNPKTVAALYDDSNLSFLPTVFLFMLRSFSLVTKLKNKLNQTSNSRSFLPQ